MTSPDTARMAEKIGKPVRLQLSRKRGFSLQALSIATNGLTAVNVARPSKWGNPFRVGGYFMMGDPVGRGGLFAMAWCETSADYADTRFTKISTNAEAVEWFRSYKSKYLPSDIAELRGKNLACFCEPGSPCHADVLLELANPSPQGGG